MIQKHTVAAHYLVSLMEPEERVDFFRALLHVADPAELQRMRGAVDLMLGPSELGGEVPPVDPVEIRSRLRDPRG